MDLFRRSKVLLVSLTPAPFCSRCPPPPPENNADGAHVSSRGLFEDNHKRRKARQAPGTDQALEQGHYQILAMHAAKW